VLELKDKVGKLDLTSLPVADARVIPAEDVAEDVISALLNLGYKEPHVRKALAGLDAGGEVTVEGLLKQALKSLMK
jgi:Holliday junction DNA helicase RuvA